MFSHMKPFLLGVTTLMYEHLMHILILHWSHNKSQLYTNTNTGRNSKGGRKHAKHRDGEKQELHIYSQIQQKMVGTLWGAATEQ